MNDSDPNYRGRIEIKGPEIPCQEAILTPPALAFVAQLDSEFAERRVELLRHRAENRQRLRDGSTLNFLESTAGIRADQSWRVAPPAPGLVDRRVEITGPTDRKMAVNALNSGASVWMADFEDAASPTWEGVVTGQLNLIDVLDRRIDFTSDEGKEYRLGERLPTIVVRPRGWHLPEKHVCIDGRPASASVVDFALYFFHCARRQIARGQGPYFYLPKLENHLEARLWNDVFRRAQELLGIPVGTIRATVLIETITAAFEMEEILYELREHSAGLNAGRWDYFFSVIKNLGGNPRFVLPDRGAVTMTVPFMRAYTQLLVRTCHKRGAHAIGGMAAFVPSRRDAEVNARALAAVRADKEREAADGFDGSWVAHPDLVTTCREVFDGVLGAAPNQLDRMPSDDVGAADLLAVDRTPGQVTESGIRTNVAVSLRYLVAWLSGQGAVAINNLMEDAATVEISRSQLWQWVRHGVVTVEGDPVTPDFVRRVVDEEAADIRYQLLADDGAEALDRLDDAVGLLCQCALSDDFVEFLTLPAYTRLLELERSAVAVG